MQVYKIELLQKLMQREDQIISHLDVPAFIEIDEKGYGIENQMDFLEYMTEMGTLFCFLRTGSEAKQSGKVAQTLQAKMEGFVSNKYCISYLFKLFCKLKKQTNEVTNCFLEKGFLPEIKEFGFVNYETTENEIIKHYKVGDFTPTEENYANAYNINENIHSLLRTFNLKTSNDFNEIVAEILETYIKSEEEEEANAENNQAQQEANAENNQAQQVANAESDQEEQQEEQQEANAESYQEQQEEEEQVEEIPEPKKQAVKQAKQAVKLPEPRKMAQQEPKKQAEPKKKPPIIPKPVSKTTVKR